MSKDLILRDIKQLKFDIQNEIGYLTRDNKDFLDLKISEIQKEIERLYELANN